MAHPDEGLPEDKENDDDYDERLGREGRPAVGGHHDPLRAQSTT